MMPVADKFKVKMALHPDDLPLSRSAASPASSTASATTSASWPWSPAPTTA
ncbi:MAG: hypothetical protein IPP47_23050 [Bryobacterales bacterium]|nr:hypothetical protein [Bryobacterales bacterium]